MIDFEHYAQHERVERYRFYSAYNEEVYKYCVNDNVDWTNYFDTRKKLGDLREIEDLLLILSELTVRDVNYKWLKHVVSGLTNTKLEFNITYDTQNLEVINVKDSTDMLKERHKLITAEIELKLGLSISGIDLLILTIGKEEEGVW